MRSGLILLWSFVPSSFLFAQSIANTITKTDVSVAQTVSRSASTADPATVTNNKTTGKPASPKNKDKAKTAIEQNAVSEISEFTFEQLLARRKPELSRAEVRFYENELRARPELRGAEILNANDARLRKLRETARPVLESFGRRDYTELFIYRADAPFVGLYRECIIIFSTGALNLLNASQQRAAVAHELAHEIFIEELRAADETGDNEKKQLVELKCDLAAMLATDYFAGDEPFAIAEVAEAFAEWYSRNSAGKEPEADSFPKPAVRRKCLKLFVKRGYGN